MPFFFVWEILPVGDGAGVVVRVLVTSQNRLGSDGRRVPGEQGLFGWVLHLEGMFLGRGIGLRGEFAVDLFDGGQ
jgi:hypothetical protein